MIVTIDGPAGSGKSTAARGLAQRLGFLFLDTGAMYRSVAWKCLESAVDLHDGEGVAAVAGEIAIAFDSGRVLADGIDVTDSIREPRVTEVASLVAQNAGVREAMAAQQRAIGDAGNIITEGRDQGTVVFQHARCKFFLTADVAERAVRRQLELERQGREETVEEILSQIRDRDRRDETRDVAPLKAAEDAIHFDTSGLSPEQVLDRMESIVRERMEP